jgi:K+-sensing histidine kinase KdpD
MRARLLSVLRRVTTPSLVVGIVVAASFIVVETLAVLLLKQLDPQEAFGTLYLLGVVVVSTVWGLGLAMSTSVAIAIALAYLRNWPDRHFAPFNLENGGVIVIFLVLALLTNFVEGLVRARAVEADQRQLLKLSTWPSSLWPVDQERTPNSGMNGHLFVPAASPGGSQDHFHIH